MRLEIKHITVSLATLIAAVEAQAIWQVPVANYLQSEYQAGTQNWQITQHRNDWLYFANNYGLLEFDGSRWSLYGIWNSSAIRSICIDETGDIYVGGNNEYGRFDRDELGQLTYTSLSQYLPEEAKNFGEVWNIHRMRNKLYAQTHSAIIIHNIENEQVEIVESKCPIKASEIVGETLYVASNNGISCLKGNKLTDNIAGTSILAHSDIREMRCLKNRNLLIATSRDGLYVIDHDGFHKFRTEADQYTGSNMLYALAIGENHIAQGTVTGGVAITDLNGDNARYINTYNGLHNNTVLSLYFDRNDNLWCGLDQGIDCISINSPIAQLYNSFNSLGSGYTQIIDDDKIYLGTNQGLYSAHWPLDNADIQLDARQVSGSLGQVWSLDKIGETLFCCHDKGLFTIADNQLLPAIETEGFWQVRKLPLNADIAIAGSYSGLYVIHLPLFNKRQGGGVFTKSKGSMPRRRHSK